MKDVKQGVFSFSWVVAASHKIHRSLVIAAINRLRLPVYLTLVTKSSLAHFV